MLLILSVTIAVLCGVLILRLLQKHLPGNGRLLGKIKIILLVFYVLAILYVTLLSRSTTQYANYKLTLFWSYRASLSWINNRSGIGLLITDRGIFLQIILNILLYIPLGYLLPFAGARREKPLRTASGHIMNTLSVFPWTAVLAGMALSVITEFAQLLLKLGFFEFDDIFNNTVGCGIGVVLYLLLLRPKAKKPKLTIESAE